MIGLLPDIILKVNGRQSEHQPQRPACARRFHRHRNAAARGPAVRWWLRKQCDVPESLPSTAAGIYGYLGYEMVRQMSSARQQSRSARRIQLQTVLRDEAPAGNMARVQMGMLVTGRKWCDYGYSGGMALYVKRVYPDPEWFAVIIEAVSAFTKTRQPKLSASISMRLRTDQPPNRRAVSQKRSSF